MTENYSACQSTNTNLTPHSKVSHDKVLVLAIGLKWKLQEVLITESHMSHWVG